jgi:hypothetical protein
MSEIKFNYNVETPFTEKEMMDFKEFRNELKSILKKGKLTIREKFKFFSFTIENYTVVEKTNILVFLKNRNQKVQ